MDKFYSLSATKKVKTLESELRKELKDLNDEIEDADSILSQGNRPFSSIPMPKDADYFRNERKAAFRKALKVRKALPITLKSDVMKLELKSATMSEYRKENIGLILHQFFTDRAQSLAYCKRMHILRWARICRDSKTIESLYPDYMKRLEHIVREQQDAVQRSKRLSMCTDLNKTSTSLKYVNTDDLVIYTRWLICHLHSVKHIHSFIRVLEWLPTSKQNQFQLDLDGNNSGEMKLTKSVEMIRLITRKISTAGRIFSPIKRRTVTFSETSIPQAPNLSSEKQKPLLPPANISNISAACGGGLASNEVSLSIPINDVDIASYAPVLDFLLSCYGIQVRTWDMKSRSDEMDMLQFVLRKFKSVYYSQEQLRHFPTYDTLNDILTDKPDEKNVMKTFKKSCDWENFVQLVPKVDGMQKKSMTMLKEKNISDELLRLHSQFFHVSDSQKALGCLREHANCLGSHYQQAPISVTSNKTKNDTTVLWNKIFDYSSTKRVVQKKDTLGFDIKISSDDIAGINDNELDLSEAVEMLGLEDDDERKHPLVNHGAFLSYLALRHLRIRDLQRTCLAIVNYFRSIERTLTIDDGGLVYGEDGFKLKRHSDEDRSPLGIGSQQYTHDTPTDFRLDEQEFLHSLELENQDDYYSFVDGRIHVQDAKGCYVMYDVALQDLKEIESQLLLVGSHFIAKHQTDQKIAFKKASVQGNGFDMASYGHMDVDRFGVLLDLWTNETAYLENKRKLVSCYFELYQHVFNPKEKQAIAQIITDIVWERPRFNYSGSYFVQTYRSECNCLRLRLNIIEAITSKQVDLQREYLQKIIREPEPTYGMPHGVIPIQNVSLIENRPALRHVYLLEFHPSLALLHKVNEAINMAKQEIERVHKPSEPDQFISLERRFYEVACEEYQKLKPVGNDYTDQLRRDLFSDTFMEDPLFVCTFGQSSMMSLKEKTRSVTAERESTIQSWCKLLDIITLRHRLIESCDETSILSPVYKEKAKELGFDECHLYIRAISFEFAQKKPDAETKPISTAKLIENDSFVDRYVPNNMSLAVHELDEKNVGTFSLRTQEGLLQLCQDSNIEKLRTTLLCQIVHKNLLAASLLQMDSCLVFERNIGIRDSGRALEEPMVNEDGERPADPFASAKMHDAWKRRIQEAFVSIQIEKLFLRNRMLNKYLDEKAVKGVIMNNVDEVIKLKRQMIGMFCNQLLERSSLHVLRAQVISCISNMKGLLSGFPRTRDSHFMIGTEEDATTKKDAEIYEDPAKFNKRPRYMISSDGKCLENLWYLPHFKEVLQLFGDLDAETQIDCLSTMLRILSCIFEICQYLCAHAKLGSSHARLGSKKVQFSGVNSDWGGSEGIGAELREIQQQINHLASPKDPHTVAAFLEKKRDVMFFEFDITVSRSVKNTFLAAGNEQAFKSITQCTHSSLRDLSDIARPSVYSSGHELPGPLFSEDSNSFELCPWRSYLARYGPCALLNRPSHKIEQIMLQCLAGLKTIDRHVVGGEVLSLSLLLEDALAYGSTNVASLLSSDTGDNEEQADVNPTSTVSPKDSLDVEDQQGKQRKMSTKSTPMESLDFLYDFLILYSTLEQIKDDWACRKLAIPVLKSSKQYSAFMTIYKTDVLQVVYKQIAAKQGKEKEYEKDFPIDDNDSLAIPSDVGEYEIKARQLIRLLESLECSMISDVIRRLSREHTLVVAERSRDDPNLPTDLWKKSSMKENVVMARPHMVEDFYTKLMSDHLADGDSIIFNKDHLESCMMSLASDAIQRERQTFENYAGFYEGILKKQHQAIYLKEQELKKVKNDSQSGIFEQGVEVDCLLADKCRDIILEITALRFKVSEMTDMLTHQEKQMREKFKQDYNAMVIELFNNAFNMRNRFEQFRSSLYDDVFDCLGEVRKLAVQSMKKLREKFGQADAEADSISLRLIRAEQLREAQWESKNLLNMILKLKALGHWNKTKTESKSLFHLADLQQELSRSKREALETRLLTDEKVAVLKQEIASLRKALNNSEKDCHTLRKKLSKEHKLKIEKSNNRLQEAFSQRKIDLAKTANIEKLLQELEVKEEKLKELSELTDRDTSVSKRSKLESKRLLRQVMNQLSHERSLKLDAFDRCDDLQRQVEEYEEQLEMITRPLSSQSYHASCFPSVPGGASSPQRSLISARPHTHAAIRTYLRNKSSKSQNTPQYQWWMTSSNTTQEGSKGRVKVDKVSKPAELEKGNIRLKKKISENLLTDFESLDYQ